jgi:hypothetical protein
MKGLVSGGLIVLLLLSISTSVGEANETTGCKHLLADATYLDEANTIAFSLKVIHLAESANDTRVIAVLEQRMNLAVIALQTFGIDSTQANREIIISSLRGLAEYQSQAHGSSDAHLAELLKRLKS